MLRAGAHVRGVSTERGDRFELAEDVHDQVWAETARPWPAERSLATAAAHLPALEGARVEATRIGVPRHRG